MARIKLQGKWKLERVEAMDDLKFSFISILGVKYPVTLPSKTNK